MGRTAVPVRPTKGAFAYEMQLGPLVFQWFHGTGERRSIACSGLNVGRLCIWRDRCWR